MTKHGSEGTGWMVMTIGHSTRTVETFIHLLHTCEVKQVVDVRTVPRYALPHPHPLPPGERVRDAISKLILIGVDNRTFFNE